MNFRMRDKEPGTMAGDLRVLKAKLLEARKAEKKPQAVSQKQEPPRTKLTLKKKTPAASSGASAASKSAEVKASAQKEESGRAFQTSGT